MKEQIPLIADSVQALKAEGPDGKVQAVHSVPSWVVFLLWVTTVVGSLAVGFTTAHWIDEHATPVSSRYFVDEATLRLADGKSVYSVRYMDGQDLPRVMQFESRDEADRFVINYLGGR